MNKCSRILLFVALSMTLCACDSLPSWMGGTKVEKVRLAGERIPVLPVISDEKPDATLKNTPAQFPAASPNDNWAQHGGTFNAQTGNLSADGNFDQITSTHIGYGAPYEKTLIAYPVVGGSLVYAMDDVGAITAHEAANIENVHWQYNGIVEEGEPTIIGGGMAYSEGKLYVVSGHGVVVAIDVNTGDELWRKALHVPFRSAPKIAAGKLFAITIDNQLYALNIADGNVVWTHRGISEAAGMMNSVSPTVEGDMIVVPYSSGEVYVLAVADGKEIWNEAVAAGKHAKANALFAGIGGDPIVDGGVVFSVSSGGITIVQALSNGQRVWEKPIGSMNTPWMVGDSLFVITTENVLLSVVKYDGRIRWATQLQTYANVEDKKDPITWKGPVMVNEKLAVVGSNGELLWVSAQDGTILSMQTIPENIFTAPVVAGGRMYLIDQNATLYSLK